MGKVPSVKTPGSYSLSKLKKKKKKEKLKAKNKSPGRPSLAKKRVARKLSRSKYTREDMERAAELVLNDGLPVSTAAKRCNVPRVTLIDMIKGTHKFGGAGRPTILTKVEEDVLVEMLVLLGQFNYPLTKRHLRDMVKNYLDQHRETRLVVKL
jgi:transposase-like protein